MVNITWKVSDLCNYRCSYCNFGSWGGMQPNNEPEKLDLLKENLDRLFEHYGEQGYRRYKFYFTGGEPLLWKHLLPVVEYAKEKAPEVHIGVNTNFSRKVSWWEKNYHLFDDVVASFHPEWADPNSFLDRAEYLQDKIKFMCLRILMQEKNFHYCMDFADNAKVRLKRYAIEYSPVLDEMSPDSSPYQYSEQWMNDWVKENNFEMWHSEDMGYTHMILNQKPSIGQDILHEDDSTSTMISNRVIAEGKNFFKGWYCWTHEGLYIDADGSVTPASCGVMPSAGNMYTREPFKLPNKAIVCPKYHCHCGSDVNITKHRPDADVKQEMKERGYKDSEL